MKTSNETQKTQKINKPKKHSTKKAINNTLKRRDCGTSSNAYTSFEDKLDKVFEQNHIDILSAGYNLEQAVVKDLKKAVSPSKFTPQNDFYSYINERWLKNIDVAVHQQYITQIDDFRLVQDKVFRELIAIVEQYIKDHPTKLGKCLRNAYRSFQTYNTTAQTRCLSQCVVRYIDAQLSVPDNVWGTLAQSNKNELISWGSPFVWSINPDDKDPTKYMCYLEPPQLTLMDIELYLDEPTSVYKTTYRAKYIAYLDDVFEVAFGKHHGFVTTDVFDCEVEMLNAMGCNFVKEEDEDGYNVITAQEALHHFGFDWRRFCASLGFDRAPDEFVTSNVNYLLCGTKLLKERWNSSKWRTYWIYLYIRQQTRWDERGWKVFYEFHGQFLRGQSKPVDAYIRPIFGMGFTFNTFLTNQYIAHYKNEQAVAYVQSMADDLKTVFKRIIRRNTWMQPTTRQTALDKLDAIKLIVGSPPLLREDPLLEYKADDPWGNLLKMAFWRHDQALRLVGKPVVDIPVVDWSTIPPKFVSTQAYVVNAMYTPTENTIYIPLGYIQKPFVDLDERGIEYNLAHIGFTIAHEMSHALDDLGSKYDKDGRLHDWWTPKDKAQFERIQRNIVKQYEMFARYDGIEFDAWPSIGEDLADIAGFAICQEYLRDFQLKNQDILPVQSLSFMGFFIYFALQSRQKVSKKSILAQLKTNPHPLDKYRCNIPLSRSRIFRAIYNIQKGDKMSWNSTNNVWTD